LVLLLSFPPILFGLENTASQTTTNKNIHLDLTTSCYLTGFQVITPSDLTQEINEKLMAGDSKNSESPAIPRSSWQPTNYHLMTTVIGY